MLAEKAFFLVQEIRHQAAILHGFRCIAHWIPSHIDRHSGYFLGIRGNTAADRLANRARDNSENGLADDGDINLIRAQIITESAELLWKIKGLINPPPPDGTPMAEDGVLISIITTVKDEERALPHLLDSILAQEGPLEMCRP